MLFQNVMIAVVVIMALALNRAESKPQNYERLKKLLEEKYIPKQSPTTNPVIPDKNNTNSTTTKPATPPTDIQKPNRGGTLLPFTRPTSMVSAVATGIKSFCSSCRLAEYRAMDDQSTASSILATLDSIDPKFLEVRPHSKSHPSSRNIIVAQQSPQVQATKRERFVVQFKPNTTQRQIDALLAKYQIHSAGGVPKFGILYLERNTQQGARSDPRSSDTIINLRGEPIVQSAFADTFVSPRSVPQTGNEVYEGVDVNGAIAKYNWIWTAKSSFAPGQVTFSPKNEPLVLDGNWGLKLIRMPPVWSIIQRYRKANSKLSKPRIAIVDTGFATHEDLDFTLWAPHSSEPVTQPVILPFGGSCFTTHGSHVLGIVGAKFSNGIGIDGIVPDAQIDALLMTDPEDPIFKSGNITNSDASRDVLFTDLFEAVNHYLQLLEFQGYLKKGNPRIVINMSLGGNYISKPTAENTDPEVSEAIKGDLEHQARIWATMALFYQDTVLFVVATGNDSKDRSKPLDAIYSHPLAWLANGNMKLKIDRPRNILIVEAIDRTEQRADFSNAGGNVSAPGVDILSTWAPGDNSYSVCNGTSQAAPHVTGIAALMFELDPSKKPAEISDIIKASAINPVNAPGVIVTPRAPRFDALEAVLRLSRYNDSRNPNLVRLADLNWDGKVDIKDMVWFVQDLRAIEDNRKNGTPFSYDMNGDGKVDNNECHWPRSDLNGDGRLSLSLTDAKQVLGTNLTDWEVLKLAWTDTTKSFNTAAKETGLEALLNAFDIEPTSSASPRACR